MKAWGGGTHENISQLAKLHMLTHALQPNTWQTGWRHLESVAVAPACECKRLGAPASSRPHLLQLVARGQRRRQAHHASVHSWGHAAAQCSCLRLGSSAQRSRQLSKCEVGWLIPGRRRGQAAADARAGMPLQLLSRVGARRRVPGMFGYKGCCGQRNSKNLPGCCNFVRHMFMHSCIAA